MEFLKDKEYLGTVQDMHLNGDYCAVRFDGKILLHVLEGNDTVRPRDTRPQAARTLTMHVFELGPKNFEKHVF